MIPAPELMGELIGLEVVTVGCGLGTVPDESEAGRAWYVGGDDRIRKNK